MNPWHTETFICSWCFTGAAVRVSGAGWASGTGWSVLKQQKKHWLAKMLAKEPGFCPCSRPCVSHAAMASAALTNQLAADRAT